jgi:DNA-binding GntR family transcriptional regulator
MEALVEKGDIEGYFTAYFRLRRQIIEAADNPVLAGMLDSILEKSRVIIAARADPAGARRAGPRRASRLRRGDARRGRGARRATAAREHSQRHPHLKRFQNFII